MQSAVIAGIVSLAGVAGAQAEDVPPTPVPALDPAPAVGGKARWVFDLVGGQFGNSLGGLAFLGPVSFSSTTADGYVSEGTLSLTTTSLALTPSVDYFVTDRLSIGGRLNAGILWSSAEQRLAAPTGAPIVYDSIGYKLGLAPRVGYVVPISSTVAFWPRAAVGYEFSETYNDGSLQGDSKTLFFESNLGAAIRVSSHTLLDLGPVLSYRRTNSVGSMQQVALVGGVPQNGDASTFDASFRASVRVDF